jgi:hypothetical protein
VCPGGRRCRPLGGKNSPERGACCPEREACCPEHGACCPEHEACCPEREARCPERGACCPEHEAYSPEHRMYSSDNALLSSDNGLLSPDNAPLSPDNASLSPDNAPLSPDNASLSSDNAPLSSDCGAHSPPFVVARSRATKQSTAPLRRERAHTNPLAPRRGERARERGATLHGEAANFPQPSRSATAQRKTCGASRRRMRSLSRPCRGTFPRPAGERKAGGGADGKDITQMNANGNDDKVGGASCSPKAWTGRQDAAPTLGTPRNDKTSATTPGGHRGPPLRRPRRGRPLCLLASTAAAAEQTPATMQRPPITICPSRTGKTREAGKMPALPGSKGAGASCSRPSHGGAGCSPHFYNHRTQGQS